MIVWSSQPIIVRPVGEVIDQSGNGIKPLLLSGPLSLCPAVAIVGVQSAYEIYSDTSADARRDRLSCKGRRYPGELLT